MSAAESRSRRRRGLARDGGQTNETGRIGALGSWRSSVWPFMLAALLSSLVPLSSGSGSHSMTASSLSAAEIPSALEIPSAAESPSENASDQAAAREAATGETDAASCEGITPAPQPIPTPTLGGSQFWGDVMLRRGWRIQRHVFTGTCRLLDPLQRQHATGSREQCLAVLNLPARLAEVPPMEGEVTILIHGILRGSGSLGRIGKRLDQAGLQPLRFDYPSTQCTIEQAADCLAEAIDSLDPAVTRVNFVVHSMGGLVVRAYGRHVAEQIAAGQTRSADRLGRLVMLGTPNHGAEMASHFKNFAPFEALFGPAGRQLAHNETTIAELPRPPLEFACIAGIRGTAKGYNPFIPGDDDGTVTLESARLSGASDFLAVRGMHTFLMYQTDVVDAVERYLRTGALRADGTREPIE